VSTEDDTRAALDEARAVIDRVRTQLVAFSPPTEQLADIIVPKPLLGIQRRGRLKKAGEVWHLGIFLMDADANLYRAGETVRSQDMPHTDHNSAYKAERREFAYAVYRAGYPAGSIVNFGVTRIDVDGELLTNPSSPLFIRGRHTFVRWRSGAPDAEAVLFTDYLNERLGLLLNPPVGSTE
jgi:hypothetical protein